MIGMDNREVEREKVAILKVLKDAQGAIGSNIIARQLNEEYGITLSERAVRYHLKLLDERDLTLKISKRDGRVITQHGLEELANAMVSDKVGFVIDKIEKISYTSTFDPATAKGQIPINTSIFKKSDFKKALKIMEPAFKKGVCVSELVAIAHEGEKLGGSIIPNDCVGFATVCSLVYNSTLLKKGIPLNSKFGGTLQIRDEEPWRFTELIDYAGSSLDPSEIFIASNMTDVSGVTERGNGKILANYRDVPAVCLGKTVEVIEELKKSKINGLLVIGEQGKAVCEMPAGVNRAGIILAGGLNPVAMAAEQGIRTINKAMTGLIDYDKLTSFWNIK